MQLAYKIAGGTAAYTKGPLDRCLRDVLTMNQHVASTLRTYEMASRLNLGWSNCGGSIKPGRVDAADRYEAVPPRVGSAAHYSGLRVLDVVNPGVGWESVHSPI